MWLKGACPARRPTTRQTDGKYRVPPWSETTGQPGNEDGDALVGAKGGQFAEIDSASLDGREEQL